MNETRMADNEDHDPAAVVELHDGVVNYAGRRALNGVTLRVTRGQTMAILGANGSGKSTLVRAVLGLVPLTRGHVHLFGIPLRRFRDWKRIGYVPQRLGAGSGVPATVREVVASGRLARRGLFRPVTGADRRAVERALAAVGLTDRARDPVATLSGGQQQRTLIARALAGEPELLILDEPTAGVDAVSQEALAATLRQFTADGGTVLLVAHELGPLASQIDRAIVLAHGTVVHDGAVPVLASNDAYLHPHIHADRSLWGTS